MADLITRLKVDSTEYDAKIKRAAQGLQHYVQSAHDSGDVIGRLLGDTKKYVESLGNMATVSTTARGRLNELTAAFTDLRSVYNSLSEEEKSAKGGFGQELNKQLEILKGRINDTKNELKGIDQELGNTKQAEVDTKGGLEGLTSALGINIKTLAGWGSAIAAGKVALDVAKDAFFASESSVDEWGRTVAASQSLYEGFLTAINNGDISGYLSNIDSIVKAARLAYDELDKLGTMKTIQAPQISKQQLENERIRSMIQTGRYIAPQDGRKNAVFNGREMQTGDKLTAGQIRALEKQLQGGMQKMVKLVGNEVDQTGKAINAYYDKLAKQNGMSLQEFKKGTSSWEEFSKRMQGYEQYKEWDKQARTEFAKQGGRGYVNFDKSNPFAEFRKWGTFRVDKEGDNSYKDLVTLIQQRDQKVGQVYSTQAQAYRTMNRAEGFTVSKLMGNGGTGNKNKKEYDDLQKVQQEIAKLTKEAYTADESRVEEIKAEIAGLQEEERRMTAIRDLVTNKNNDPLKALESQFPDMSKENYNTGYAGSAQAKYDSARVDLALGPMNLDAVNSYISSVKGMLKDADLGSELYNNMTEKLKDATTFSTILQEAMTSGVSAVDLSSVAQEMKRKLLEGDIDEDAWQQFLDQINEKIEDSDLKLKIDVNTGDVRKQSKEMAKDWQAAGSAIQAVGNAMQQIENPAAKVMGTIAQAVATMALSYSQAAASPAVTGTGWGWIAFAATGVATMLSSIAAIKQATSGFANGGVIPGNSMSGDNLRGITPDGTVYGLNSQEIILNRAQQGNLASQLEGGSMQNLKIDWVLRSDKLYAVMNNRGRRTGKGELVQRNRI